MIINEQKHNLQTSGEFSTTEFRIDPKYRTKVLWMLINQYRHKVRTPVQEIISNARDAQRENGNPDRAIKIQLPTAIEPTFRVRDYGVGMSESRVKDIFTSFGASTKNADNEQTGGFGIGAKSPLAYTDQFNIKTFVDGTYWLYVVSKTAQEGIAIHLLGKGDTDEENGTEVQIPVNPSDRRTFIKAACRCTMFWDVEPEFNLPEEELYREVNGTYLNSLSIHSESELSAMFDRSIIVSVDGIPYELDSDTLRKVKSLMELKNKLNYNSYAVIRLNVGDIDLLQTRENIDESERTLSQLHKYGLKALTELNEYLASCLNAKTLQERIEQYKDVSEKFNNIGHHRFARVFDLQSSRLYLSSSLSAYGYAMRGKWGAKVKTPQKKGKSYFDHSVKYNNLDTIYWDNLGYSESSHNKARRLRYALEQSGKEEIRVIERHNADGFTWVRTVRMLGAKPLSSLPIPPKKARTTTYNSSGKRVKLKPDHLTVHYMRDCGTKYPKEINYKDNSTKFVYVDFSTEFTAEWRNLIKEFTDYTPVKLSKAAIKTIKDDANFTTLDDFKTSYKVDKKLVNAYVSFRSGREFNIDYRTRNCLNALGNEINDNILLAMLNKYKALEGGGSFPYLPKQVQEELDKKAKDKIKTNANTVKRINNRLERYPMLRLFESYYSRRNEKKKMFIDYINNTHRLNTMRRF